MLIQLERFPATTKLLIFQRKAKKCKQLVNADLRKRGIVFKDFLTIMMAPPKRYGPRSLKNHKNPISILNSTIMLLSQGAMV